MMLYHLVVLLVAVTMAVCLVGTVALVYLLRSGAQDTVTTTQDMVTTTAERVTATPNVVTTPPDMMTLPPDMMTTTPHVVTTTTGAPADAASFPPALTGICGGHRRDRHRRISGGHRALRGEFPWMAMVLIAGENRCGGSVVSSRHVLTAAHCLWDRKTASQIPVAYVEVIAGKHTREAKIPAADPSEQRLGVATVVFHPHWQSGKNSHHDLALLVLTSDLAWTAKVQPICLPGPTTRMPSRALTAGWGRTNTRHRLVMLPKYAEVLQKATLDVYTGQECLTRFPTMDSRTRRKINDKVLCGVGKRHYKSFSTDACHGDSGGPLFAVPDGRMQYVLLGVVWWGLGCDVPGEPGLYLRISHFVTWIRKVLPSS